MAATPCSSWSSWRQLANSSRKRGSALSAAATGSNGPPTAPLARWKRAGLKPMRAQRAGGLAIALAGRGLGAVGERRPACASTRPKSRSPSAAGLSERGAAAGSMRGELVGVGVAGEHRGEEGLAALEQGGVLRGRRRASRRRRLCIWATWRSIWATSPFISVDRLEGGEGRPGEQEQRPRSGRHLHPRADREAAQALAVMKENIARLEDVTELRGKAGVCRLNVKSSSFSPVGPYGAGTATPWRPLENSGPSCPAQ